MRAHVVLLRKLRRRWRCPHRTARRGQCSDEAAKAGSNNNGGGGGGGVCFDVDDNDPPAEPRAAPSPRQASFRCVTVAVGMERCRNRPLDSVRERRKRRVEISFFSFGRRFFFSRRRRPTAIAEEAEKKGFRGFNALRLPGISFASIEHRFLSTDTLDDRIALGGSD